MVRSYGLIPGIILLIGTGVMGIAIFMWMAGVSFSSVISHLPKISIPVISSGKSESAPTLEETTNQEIMRQAQEALEESDKEFTRHNLNKELERLSEEGEDTDGSVEPTEAVRNDRRRSRNTRVKLSLDVIDEEESYLRTVSETGEEKYRRIMFISEYPAEAEYGWLDKFTTRGLNAEGATIRMSYQIFPRDTSKSIKELQKRARQLKTSIRKKQEEKRVDTIEEGTQLSVVEELQKEIERGETKLFDLALYFEVVAPDKGTLDQATKEARQHMRESGATLVPAYDKQLKGFRSMVPYGRDLLKKRSVMTLESLGLMFPFTDRNIVDRTGTLLGINEDTQAPAIVDRWDLSGHNALITGKIGSGKSYLSQLMILRQLQSNTDLDVLVVDPTGDFTGLVGALGGDTIDITAGCTINPLDIKEIEDDSVIDDIDGHPWNNKIDTVIAMFKAYFNDDERTTTEFTREREGVLRRALKYAYIEKGITKDIATHGRENPTISDLRRILYALSEGEDPQDFLQVPPEAQEAFRKRYQATYSEVSRDAISDHANSLYLSLESFREGGQYENFNGKSTVSLSGSVVQFDLSGISESENSMYMQVVVDWLFQRAKGDPGKKVITIDEAHYMLRSPQALNMLNLFVRHSRHYNSGVTLLSQTVDEFVRNEQATDIYDQCDIRLLMHHARIGDESIDALGITDHDVGYVKAADKGNEAESSQCLAHVSSRGKMRIRVPSSDMEHHIVENKLDHWTFAVASGAATIDEIPEEEQGRVQGKLEEHTQKEGSALAPGDD
jgi:type IV secretory pathway VirB4 component